VERVALRPTTFCPVTNQSWEAVTAQPPKGLGRLLLLGVGVSKKVLALQPFGDRTSHRPIRCVVDRLAAATGYAWPNPQAWHGAVARNPTSQKRDVEHPANGWKVRRERRRLARAVARLRSTTAIREGRRCPFSIGIQWPPSPDLGNIVSSYRNVARILALRRKGDTENPMLCRCSLVLSLYIEVTEDERDLLMNSGITYDQVTTVRLMIDQPSATDCSVSS